MYLADLKRDGMDDGTCSELSETTNIDQLEANSMTQRSLQGSKYSKLMGLTSKRLGETIPSRNIVFFSCIVESWGFPNLGLQTSSRPRDAKGHHLQRPPGRRGRHDPCPSPGRWPS